MGQASNTASMSRTLAARPSAWMAIILLAIIGVTSVAAGLLVIESIEAGNRAAGVKLQLAGSPLDDYGLRHPRPFVAAPSRSLDDYGLRHPRPFVAAPSRSLDDYGLRHPRPFVAAPSRSLDDYGLRHPNGFEK